jgi:molecular chaperone Hsp33
LIHPSADALTRFVFEHAAVRGALVTLPDTVRAVLACHRYPPPLQRVLAELVAATALLASTLKFTGSLIMQLQGDGPVRLLVVECTEALGLRATAQWDAERAGALGADATLADLAGGPAHGRLVLTLDPKGAGTVYQGIVALEAGSVAGLIEHYLATSEQLPSRIVLATGETPQASSGGTTSAAGPPQGGSPLGGKTPQASSGGTTSAAGPPQGGSPLGGETPQASTGGTYPAAGLLVQRLPGATEEDDVTWSRARNALDALVPAILLAHVSAADQLAATFPQDDVRIFRAKPVSFACSCSRKRVENALRIAGAAEIESILAERGDVEVTCEFCNRRYAFEPAEARALFVPESAGIRH